MFQENEALGGTFGAGFNSVNFFGNIVFSGNVGPALRVSQMTSDGLATKMCVCVCVCSW